MNYPRLRDLREDKDLKQTNISELLKIGLSTYQRYERGELKIYLETATELANYYNVSLDYIAGRTNDKRGLTRSELSNVETDFIKKFRSLSENGKGKIIERLDIILEQEQEEQAKLRGVI